MRVSVGREEEGELIRKGQVFCWKSRLEMSPLVLRCPVAGLPFDLQPHLVMPQETGYPGGVIPHQKWLSDLFNPGLF